MNSIFTAPDAQSTDDISGKLTYTNVMEIIPENYVTKPCDNWTTKYDTEWRWRFLKFDGRFVMEVSYINKTGKRFFCDKFGQWIDNIITESKYDKYVTETYYVYTKN
jgi:hypothetical protein